MDKFIFLTVVIFMARLYIVEGVYSAAKEKEIRTEIVARANYDIISRPDDQTSVKVGISIHAIDELNLKSQSLAAVGWLTLEWEDSRWEWDSSTKDDIEFIFSKPDEIWKPELTIANARKDIGIVSKQDLYLRIKSNGAVEWKPQQLFITHCEVDITYYPYDRQKCSITIASWGYTIEEVALVKLDIPINLEDFEENGEWEIFNSETKESNLTETRGAGAGQTFPRMHFWIYISRRTYYYNLNVVLPIFLTSLLVALTFIVPVGNKLSYILTVFLSIVVLLTLVAASLPSTSIHISVLGLYLGMVTVMAAIGILLTVLILIIFHREGDPPSSFIILKITRVVAVCTCFGGTNKVEPAQTADGDTQSIALSDVCYDISWKVVATILDRFCFIVFLVVTIIINVSFVIVLVTGGKATYP